MSDNTRQDSEYSDYIEDSSREDFCDSERALRAAEEGTPRQFRKKPVVIEAVQWDGDKATANEFIGTDYGNDWFYYDGNSGNNRRIVIPTLEGNHVGEIGDWIIKGVKGEFYPCKSDIFAMTYEIVSPEAAPAPAPCPVTPGELRAFANTLGISKLRALADWMEEVDKARLDNKLSNAK